MKKNSPKKIMKVMSIILFIGAFSLAINAQYYSPNIMGASLQENSHLEYCIESSDGSGKLGIQGLCAPPPPPSPTAPAYIYGYVTGGESEGLSGVTVNLQLGTTTIRTTTTSSSGFYGVLTHAISSSTTVNVEFVKEGYNSERISLTVNKDGTYYRNVAMNPLPYNVLVLVHGFASEPGAMKQIESAVGDRYSDVFYVDLYSLFEGTNMEMKVLKNPTQNQLDDSDNSKTQVVQHLVIPIGPYTTIQSEIDYWETRSLSGLLYHAILDNIPSRQGAENRMDIASHSMGGLVTRSMIKFYAESSTIGDFDIGTIATLGTPNHGTQIAKWAKFAVDVATSPSNAMEDFLDFAGVSVDDIVKDVFNSFYSGLGDAIVTMTNGDFILGHLGQMVPGSTFLDNLNDGDETPYGGIDWITQRGRENTDQNLNVDVETSLKWCDGGRWLPDFPCGINLDIEVDLPHYTDIVWGEITWASKKYCLGGFCKTISIPTGTTESDNDGVVDYSSVALSGANRNFSDPSYIWTHGEVRSWNSASSSSTLKDNLTPWFNP